MQITSNTYKHIKKKHHKTYIYIIYTEKHSKWEKYIKINKCLHQNIKAKTKKMQNINIASMSDECTENKVNQNGLKL